MTFDTVIDAFQASFLIAHADPGAFSTDFGNTYYPQPIPWFLLLTFWYNPLVSVYIALLPLYYAVFESFFSDLHPDNCQPVTKHSPTMLSM